jgi:SAM-dependent methyltransferase
MAHYYHYDGLAPENLTRVPCAVCGREAGRDIGIDNRFHIQRCADCGFVFVNPRPSSEQLARFYEKFYNQDAVVPERWELEMGGIFDECRDWLLDRQSTEKVLDVGSSFGHFLMKMGQRRWSTEGIEPPPVATAYSRRHLEGTVHEAGFGDVEFEPKSFDAVVSLYVLEHVGDPCGFVQKVFDILRPGGLAIIRIPLTAPLFPLQRLLRRPLMYAPMHLNDFTPDSMQMLAREIGFREVSVHVGARRHAHDPIENVGARVLAALGRIAEIASGGRAIFPLVGALSYRLHR